MRSMAQSILTDNHLRAIGLIAAEWSWTESLLEEIIWEVAQISHARGRAITTHVASEMRLHMLTTLAKISLPNLTTLKQLDVIVERVRVLRIKRNNIVHALWLSSKPQEYLGLIASAMKRPRKPIPALHKTTARGKIVMTSNPYTAKQILAIGAEITQLVFDMHHLLEQIKTDRSAGGIGLEKP